jgi:hopanoid-associated phosphorylase
VSAASEHRGFVIAVCGLRAEARIAARSADARAVAGGGDAVRLGGLIQEQIARGGKAIISFGVAAGLAPGFDGGTCVVGSEVVSASDRKRYAVNRTWTGELRSRLVKVEYAPIAGVDQPLVATAEKLALRGRTQAGAADMESHIAAELAARHGLPFAVLRVITDPVERQLPPAALVGMRQDGEIDVAAVIASLARNPTQLRALMGLAFDTKRAFAALLRCQDLLGPRLGFGDLG